MTELAKSNKRYLLWAAEVYIITIAIVVFSAWMNNMHPYEMKLTVSKYIGLQHWTSVLYFVMCALICLFLFLYIIKTNFKLIKKYVYLFVLSQVLGCAWFPSVGKANKLLTITHRSFAYGLIFGIAISFLVMLLWGTRAEQRLFAICGLLYTSLFVFMYTCKIEEFKQTIFIWENVIIFLLFLELSLEEKTQFPPKDSSLKIKK